jgi:hypothetical protein
VLRYEGKSQERVEELRMLLEPLLLQWIDEATNTEK